MDFSDKVCIVTGGANGIGRCIVENFLYVGAKVAVIDTDFDSEQMMKSQYSDNNLLLVHGDITREDVVNHFVNQVLERFHTVDYLINNACISKKGILSGCSFDDFNYVLKLGITAPYLLTKLFLPHFSERGAIVNLSSTRAFMSQADTESYTAAKGGIAALTHALSVSLSGKIRVNSISPGWIDTGAYQKTTSYIPNHSIEDYNQHPAGRIGHPEDIAKMVLFLCSDDAKFITGENITIDGGMTKQMIYHNDCGWTYHV